MNQLKTQGLSKAADRVDRPGGSVASSVSRSREAVSAAASEARDAGGADLKALRSDLSDLKDTDYFSDETSTHDRQNPSSFWPVARYLKAGMQIPLPGLLNEIEQTP